MTEQTTQPQPRVYSLDQHGLTQEQVAVTFAMTSRSPDPFDEIAGRVREADSAAQFHERWVLGYGHASVAEHAVLHLAVENISRLACDTLEDNRLASYTEKSSRYQVIDRDQYHHPSELDDHPDLSTTYHQACRTLFDAYHQALEDSIAYLQRQEPNRKKETGSARALRMRRVATDNCRALLPAATLTNVGVTANARTLEHAISKLMSSPRREEQDLGSLLLRAGLAQTPTLIRHASPNQYLQRTREAPGAPRPPAGPAGPGGTIPAPHPRGQRHSAQHPGGSPHGRVPPVPPVQPVLRGGPAAGRTHDPPGRYDGPSRNAWSSWGTTTPPSGNSRTSPTWWSSSWTTAPTGSSSGTACRPP